MRAEVLQIALAAFDYVAAGFPATALVMSTFAVIFGLVPATRSFVGYSLQSVAHLTLFCVWLLSLAITFGVYGWVVSLAAFAAFAIGVLPIGGYAAYFELHNPTLALTIVVSVFLAPAIYFTGVVMTAKED